MERWANVSSEYGHDRRLSHHLRAMMARQRPRHVLERAALSVDAELHFHQRRHDHQPGAEQVAAEDLAARAAFDEHAEEPRAEGAAQERAEGIEERDGERAQLERET